MEGAIVVNPAAGIQTGRKDSGCLIAVGVFNWQFSTRRSWWLLLRVEQEFNRQFIAYLAAGLFNWWRERLLLKLRQVSPSL
jgi:hypothetical protein